ncbi:MAG TPA: hypothetical protein VES40_01225, partial [Ilumatobacteraceae bacterium]|nr:hypothetical protein [Ilumatobacteraceae bacterium]
MTQILVSVWVAAFFIPSGQYRLDDAGSPIAGSYEQVDSPLNLGERVQDLLYAPINGPNGIQDPGTGFVSPFVIGLPVWRGPGVLHRGLVCQWIGAGFLDNDLHDRYQPDGGGSVGPAQPVRNDVGRYGSDGCGLSQGGGTGSNPVR